MHGATVKIINVLQVFKCLEKLLTIFMHNLLNNFVPVNLSIVFQDILTA